MKYTYKIYILLLTVIMFSACATYEPQYKNEDAKDRKAPDKAVDRTFYLIGDAGKSPIGGMSTALTIFNKHISNKNTEKDYTIFLGDNIYPSGLPKKGEEGRAHAENALEGQIRALEGFEGTTFFIPGNHDWYTDGPEGLKRQEEYLEEAIRDNVFEPESGCPLEDVDIGDNIKLIMIDTQWYLENWNNHPTINDKCEIKTRERFFLELEGELKKAQNKMVILAMHHPMYTNGIHGGQYAFSKHLFPTQRSVPLPVLGSLVSQMRTQGGVSIQDRYNERYNNLMKRIETMAIDENKLVLVSGHEHTLQYNVKEGVKQIVSGSGAKESYAALAKTGQFVYGKQGFAELKIYKDGSVWVTFYGEENGQPKHLYSTEVFKPTEPYDVSYLPESFPQEIEASVYTEEQTDKTDFFKSIWGDHYRKVYSKKIKVKVATLDTLYGGLEVVRPGGGHQTRSLRLKTKDGRELNMRALKKSATQYLQTVLFKDTYIQDEFEKTKVESLILDFYTAAHPYAFLTVPVLSDAAELYHTNPRLFYIPKHQHLGKYNKDYGDELYMIEERPEENYTHERNFGYADDIESTHDIIEKVREDEKYIIDQNAYVRARLFDMLIGDWDRHQDQWRWAQFDQENGDKLFRPIPRDRDQVYSNFDGSLLDVMRTISGGSKQLQVYDEELQNIEWMNAAGIKLDRVLVQQSKKDLWIEQARFLQDQITDDVIEEAFSKVPKGVQDETLAEIKENLKGRKKNLVDIAQRYYNHLNELAVLTGTDKDDYIEITRTGNKETHIKISRIKDGKKADVLVDKTFHRDITKEIWVYGLDDEDIFEVNGKANNLIFTRLIGGQDNDTYKIKNGKRLKVYDHESQPNTIEENEGATIRFTDIYQLNLFDYKKHIVKNYVTTPAIGFNPDDGVSLGISYVKIKDGFQRNPYSQQHQFKGGYFFATKGFSLEYDGEYANIMNDWNLHIGGRFTTANFANNFFGYGNETDNPDNELDFDYNRVKTSIYMAKAGILKKGSFGSNYGIRTVFEAIQIEDTENRFITEVIPATNENFYDRRLFGALELEYNYESYDNKLNPTRGMTFFFQSGVKTELEETERTYGYINSNLGFYNAISRDRKLVLKTDVRTQFRIGNRNNFLFYQAANIGGRNSLRGFRRERFTGRNSFVGSADLRYSFKQFKTSLLPLQIGVFGGFDVGRVWLKGDFSEKWHNDYGGGLWVTAAESVKGGFSLFNSVEGWRFTFALGLNF